MKTPPAIRTLGTMAATLALLACSSATQRHTVDPCSTFQAVSHERVGSPPTPSKLLIPPNPPRYLRGTTGTVHAVIDPAGDVKSDSVAVCGVVDGAYAAELANVVRSVRFNPGVVDGRPVRSIFTATLSF